MADSIFDQLAIDMNFDAETTKREAYQTDSTWKNPFFALIDKAGVFWWVRN